MPAHRSARLLLLSLVLAAAGPARAADATPAERPRLVVLLVVDQMRTDYLDWYGAHWKKGLRRLYDEGAQLTNGRYPYLNTVTCPGHATIGTGAYPRTHGMISNGWYDRDRKKVVECTDDPDAPLVAYGPARLLRGDSAKNLAAPTLGDEMQGQLSPKPRVVSFSWKARSAIDLASRKPDLAVWFEGGAFVTSSAFAAEPTPWLKKYLDANPPKLDVWERLLPLEAYKHADDAIGEKPPTGWGRTFPHPLKVGSTGIGRFGSSPAADEYVAQLGRAALAEMKLGQGPGTDLLALGFSMTDAVGHAFGPLSHEVQDVLARLDVTIGQLLEDLDAQVGRGRYVVALSSDHGVGLIPEQLTAEGKDAGRIASTDFKAAVNELIAGELGEGKHVAEMSGNDIYLAPGVPERLAAKAGAMKRVVARVRALPGVAAAFAASDLRDAARARDPIQRGAALSYFRGRSGDIIIAPKPDWTLGSTLAANHGSLNEYDTRVPILFYGQGIKPGRYDRPASPADIAPTLAHLVGVKMPKAEGRAILDVLAAAPKGAPLRKARTPKRK